MTKDMRIAIVAVTIALILSLVLGYYWATITVTNASASPAESSNIPYVLNLVEIMDVNYNSSGAQARFYVVSDNGLASSANISIPSHRLIELIITAYDMGSAPPPSQYDKVTGTVGNQITVVNGMVSSGTNVSQQWEQNYTSVPSSMVLHTFTVPQLNLNIPVIAGDTEIAYFYANSTGTFTWFCMSPCGSGSDGLGGNMVTSGWMTGNITVY